MKKIPILLIFLVSLTTGVLVSCNKTTKANDKIKIKNLENAKARDIEYKKGTATVSFDKKEYDFGTVNEGDIVETTFIVTNIGETDLIISRTQPSCGCTVPTWTKEPIKPGGTGEVFVKFNTQGKPNRQRKTVTLLLNTPTGREVLTLKGSVTPKVKTITPKVK